MYQRLLGLGLLQASRQVIVSREVLDNIEFSIILENIIPAMFQLFCNFTRNTRNFTGKLPNFPCKMILCESQWLFMTSTNLYCMKAIILSFWILLKPRSLHFSKSLPKKLAKSFFFKIGTIFTILVYTSIKEKSGLEVLQLFWKV